MPATAILASRAVKNLAAEIGQLYGNVDSMRGMEKVSVVSFCLEAGYDSQLKNRGIIRVIVFAKAGFV